VAVVERTLGLRGVVAISLSGSLGSGIFVLPGLAAAKTGPSVWLAYALAGLIVLPAAMSKAELGTAMPTAGGTYIYIERTFGPLAGTVAGAGLWLSLLLKSAFALVGFAAYLWVFADLPIKPTALVLLVAIVGLNLFGVQAVSRVQQLVIGVSFATLIGMAIWGATAFEPQLLEPSFPKGSNGFLAASAFVFVSYAGVTKVAAIANEVKNPGRNLPAGILTSIGAMIVLYAVVSLILVGNIPVEALHHDIRPIFTLAEQLGGKAVGIAVAVVAVATMTSMANAGLLSSSRFPFAMSRDDLLPHGLARIHARLKTPINAILMTGMVMVVMILALDVEKIAKLASAFMIMLYVTENVTVIVLRESRAQWYQPSFRSPLYPYMQIFGTVSGLGLLAYMGLMVPLALVSIGLPAILLYSFYGRTRADRRGVLRMMGRRPDLVEHPPERGVDAGHDLLEDAVVAVPLLGTERAPEMVVEIGAALANGNPIEVLHVTELPEQTILDSGLESSGLRQSIQRRVLALAEDEGLDLRFNEVVSRDVARSIMAASARTRCDWIVMEWAERSQRRIVRDPIGWLLDNLECNLALFRDVGVRRIREILVYPKPGPHDALVARTAAHLAEIHRASLTFCRFVPMDASAVYVHAAEEYLEQVRGMVQRPSSQVVFRGRRKLSTVAEESANYDLLVLAPTAQTTLASSIFGTREDRLVERANCSVVVLKTPRIETHTAFARVPERDEDRARFSPVDHIMPSIVGAQLPLAKKDALFAHLGRRWAGLFEDVSPRQFIEALWRRERTQNTAVGMGAAMPHIILDPLSQSYLGVFTTDRPVDYQAPDGEPVDVFFVLAGPQSDRQTHLRLLSSLSRMIQQTSLLDRLRASTSDEALVEAVDEAWTQLQGDHSEQPAP
jgi:amino acid transporter/mannitol/fructose-specific phosphotransferase system IIA component (Ntr-type)